MKRKLYEIIFYDSDMLCNTLECLTEKSNQFEWAKEFKFGYCKHDSDLNRHKELKKLHYHCLLEFSNPLESERLFNVIKEFLPNKKETDIQKAGVAAWSYLIHANTPEKHQYDFDDIVSNLDEDVLFERIEKYRQVKRSDLECQYITWIYEIVGYLKDDIASQEDFNGYPRIHVRDIINFVISNDRGLEFPNLVSFIVHNSYFVKELI